MPVFALVILACTAGGDCRQQTLQTGLSRAECSAKIAHADPKMACNKEVRVVRAKFAKRGKLVAALKSR